MTEWVENKKKVNPLLYEGKNNQIEYKAEFKTKRRFGEKNNSLYIIEQNAVVVSTGLITLAALLQCLCN